MRHFIKDPKFQKGIGISHIVSNTYGGDMAVLKFKPVTNIDWKIRQWGSALSLLSDAKIKNDKNNFTIENDAKKIVISNGTISLRINALKEYDHDRINGEAWPHLLLEQFFKNIKLCNLNNLIAEIDFDFENFINHMEGRNNDIHTFQIGWYFAIGNRNKTSNGYNDFYWFGLPFIDTPRLPMGKPYEAVDVGKEDCTNKYIINISASNYINKPTEVGDNFHVKIDILPYIKDAFRKAKAKGYLKTTNYEDLELISTNFGIEDTGTFSGEIKINKIDIFTE